MSRCLVLPLVAFSLAVAGCSSGRRAGSGSAGPDTRPRLADAGLVSTADAGSRDGSMVDDPPLAECRAVDVLFVIDDSASMADQQSSLVASFDGFVRGMRERLSSALSFHVGVVTTDTYAYNEPACRDIGDLVTRTGGLESSNATCGPFVSGGRYMNEAEPELSSRFACAARVGIGGDDDERVARALLNAISPARNAPGACNAGFLREGSLLVVVIISDEDDVEDGCMTGGVLDGCLSYGSGGTPDDWVAELAAHRDPESVVVLSLIGRRADNPCGAVVASRLLGFARRFGDNGYVGDVCAASYDEFFREALPIIDEACVALI